MALSYRNTDGAVCIADGGTPRIITIKARNNISGGYWVLGSSAKGVVGSNASTYVASDIEGYTVATQVGSEVIGLALTDIPSGTYGPAAMRGIFLLPALSGTIIGSIYSGWSVCAGSAGAVLPLGSCTALGVSVMGGVGPANLSVGRALTTAGIDGEFVAVSLNI
jgi:predicted RecA/RadA family phage recombinase